MSEIKSHIETWLAIVRRSHAESTSQQKRYIYTLLRSIYSALQTSCVICKFNYSLNLVPKRELHLFTIFIHRYQIFP